MVGSDVCLSAQTGRSPILLPGFCKVPHRYEVNAHAEHEPASVRAHACINNLPLQVIIFAFSSYMLADSFGLSGIVSILFCGLVRCPPALAFKRRTEHCL